MDSPSPLTLVFGALTTVVGFLLLSRLHTHCSDKPSEDKSVKSSVVPPNLQYANTNQYPQSNAADSDLEWNRPNQRPQSRRALRNNTQGMMPRTKARADFADILDSEGQTTVEQSLTLPSVAVDKSTFQDVIGTPNDKAFTFSKLARLRKADPKDRTTFTSLFDVSKRTLTPESPTSDKKEESLASPSLLNQVETQVEESDGMFEGFFTQKPESKVSLENIDETASLPSVLGGAGNRPVVRKISRRSPSGFFSGAEGMNSFSKSGLLGGNALNQSSLGQSGMLTGERKKAKRMLSDSEVDSILSPGVRPQTRKLPGKKSQFGRPPQ